MFFPYMTCTFFLFFQKFEKINVTDLKYKVEMVMRDNEKKKKKLHKRTVLGLGSI